MLLSVFRKFKTVANPLFLSVPAYNFAKLPSKTIVLKKSEFQEKIEVFYEDILRYAKVSPAGRMKIDPSYLSLLIKKSICY